MRDYGPKFSVTSPCHTTNRCTNILLYMIGHCYLLHLILLHRSIYHLLAITQQLLSNLPGNLYPHLPSLIPTLPTTICSLINRQGNPHCVRKVGFYCMSHELISEGEDCKFRYVDLMSSLYITLMLVNR